ncbi:metallophosphoesterase family protein [Myroides sp. LJL115]
MALKILHTADWHLGKRLDNFSRIEEQIEVLQEIVELTNEHQADVVVIAGDLFDAFNPGVDAIDLFYKTLKTLTNNGKRPVIAIAGNHDSPERIDAPDPLARECGIIFIGLPNAKVPFFKTPEGFEITKSDHGFMEIKLHNNPTALRIIHTPYANEIRLKRALDSNDKAAALNEVLKENWQNLASLYCDNKGVNLLVTHLYMLQKNAQVLEEPDGEKALKVGNADLIYTDIIPNEIQYTALGHLHKCWQLGSLEKPVVYSGSPLAYSFSESGQEKFVLLLEANANQPICYQKLKLESGRKLSRVKFNQVEQAIEWLQLNPYHLVELTLVSDEFLKADDIKRLYQAHDGIITIIPQITTNASQSDVQHSTVNLDQDIQGLFEDYFKQKYNGQTPNQEILELFNETLN